MDLKVTSHGGQANLKASIVNEISQVSANRDVVDVGTGKSNNYSKEDIAKAVKELNKYLEADNTYAEYSVHDKFGDIMIKIIDKDTKKVIVEYPPQKILDLIAKMCELSGIAIDKKA